jgi:diadenosine tetraphosphate (Ap4A) HIT family hydrolase
MSCVFCAIPEPQWLLSNQHFYVIWDKRPVTDGHALVIAKQHVENYFDLSADVLEALHNLVKQAKAMIEARYHPDGFNLLMNCGAGAGQTVFHFHMHLIPRYKARGPWPLRGFFRGRTIG